MKKLPYCLLVALIFACSANTKEKPEDKVTAAPKEGKVVIYQVFTRLFGNTNTTNKPWGTIEENGVGKFSDFTDKALQEIKALGVTHIWYTGIPHHAVIRDYTEYGISNDDPDVVKGRAGSPYAVKDYYNVDPDMAIDPDNRLQEFKDLLERTHANGLKGIIDIVPNHVARNYEGKSNPEGILNFGFSDDKNVTYHVNNNFYYNPKERFKVPVWQDGYLPLGGEEHPLADGKFREIPAKWTGNGSRLSRPGFNDWYETVKINYGIDPEGNKDFDELPQEYAKKHFEEHFAFWKDKTVPDSWKKFRDIALYWITMGVDGFRYDMAEMVPVEFWSYLNSHIKMKNPEAFIMAEVYNPGLYRDYIQKGKMDYLYDKVQLYDTLKNIMQGRGSTYNIPPILKDLEDIEHHMLHFLENHDEQRIASSGFAGDAKLGKPAMVASATISTSPTMVYFGQEVGEPGNEEAGFGSPTRTSIFDYIGVPHHQRWVNNKKFDGGQLSPEEKNLRDFYARLLNFTIESEALMGEYADLQVANRSNTSNYNKKLLSYLRWKGEEKLLVVVNFDPEESYSFDLAIPSELINKLGLKDGEYTGTDQLYGTENTLKVIDGQGTLKIAISPLQSFIYKLKID